MASVRTGTVVNATLNYIIAIGALAGLLTFARSWVVSRRARIIQDAENNRTLAENTQALAALTTTINNNVLPRLVTLEQAGRRRGY